jgi:galactosamine-6-phosphate isomerase
MNWTTFQNPTELAARAADMVEDLVLRKPNAHLCLATGNSPTGMYAELSRRLREGLDLSHLWITKLDEWIGLSSYHPATCEFYLREHVLGRWGIQEERYLAFNADTKGPLAEVARVKQALAKAPPLDLSVLGLGRNGHLGLNEPATTIEATAHIAKLEPETMAHGMLSELKTPLKEGMTLGLGELFAGEQILLLIVGSGKEEATERIKKGELRMDCPGTLLHLHPQATVLELG